MDINEAKQKLMVTDEEVKSVENYLGFAHTSINILSDLNPKAFYELSKGGWYLAQNREELKAKIKIFTDIYAVMYKDSLGSKGDSGLVRGTSTTQARRLTGATRQFISTSMDESISKTFCEYDAAALVRIRIGEGVPRLYAENYRKAGVNEQEVIIAPFCKITDNRLTSRWNGYEYYSVSVEKGELQEKSAEEIDSLMTQVIDGYEQNVSDVNEYMRLADRRIFLEEKIKRTTDIEERKYLLEELQKAEEEFSTIYRRTTTYRDNLNGLLQGMCKQKEKEIDQAKEIVDKDREQKRKELEDKKKEEERQGAITELSQKITESIQKTGKINESIMNAYTRMVNGERTFKQFAMEMGISFDSSVEVQLGKDVTDISTLVGAIGQQLQQVQVPEDSTLEDAKSQEQQYVGKFERINASSEMAKTLEEIVQLYGVQSNDAIKRSIYLQMNSLISNTRMSLLQQQRQAIQSQKVGIFDKITGKAKVRELQLQTIDLKMQLVSRTVPEEKGYYSVRDMLAEIYTFSQTELGGQYTPELGKLFNAMQSKYKDTEGNPFSMEYIKRIAETKIAKYQQRNLPAVPNKKFRLFGKTKDKIADLQAESSQVQIELNNTGTYNLRSQMRPREISATELFKQRLMDIGHNIENENEIPRTPAKTRDDTVDVFK